MEMLSLPMMRDFASTKKRVAIMDAHPTVLYALNELLNHSTRYQVSGLFRKPTELVEHLQRDPQTEYVITEYAVVGDKGMGDGARYIEYLLRRFPDRHFIVFCAMSNQSIIRFLYGRGVSALVLKTVELSELKRALDCVSARRPYFTPEMSCASSLIRGTDPVLSPRETEVLRLFAKGESMSQIAVAMNRSIKTVSTQKRTAMKKLNLSNDQLLMEYCLNAALF